MNEHAGREQEIEARHHACSYLPSAVEICTVCFLLAQLREARKGQGEGWLPPEVGEQVASRLRSASRVFHSEHGHEGPWSECKHLQCSQDRAALDALKGAR